MREKIVEKFSKFFIICCVSSIFIPGVTKNEKYDIALYIYCLWISLFSLICAIDEFAFIFSEDVTLMDISWCAFLVMSYFWTFLGRIFFLYYGNKLKIILKYWSDNLNPQIWPELREELLQTYYKNTLKSTMNIASVIVGPMFLVTLSKLFWTRLSFFPSTFSPSDYLSETHWWIILIQGVAVVSLNFSWVTSEMFIGFLLMTIISEYHYLELSLKNILDDIHFDDNGVLYKDEHSIKNPEDKKNKLNILRKALSTWIEYHGKVLRFGKLIEDYYVPLMAGTLLQITIAGCGIIVLAVSLTMPQDVVVLSYIYALPRIFMIYRICRLGDEIIAKSGNLGNICFHCNWVGLPKDITKTLLLICEAVRRPARIAISGHTTLDSQTFRRVMYVQYRFLTFLQDMVHKKSENK